MRYTEQGFFKNQNDCINRAARSSCRRSNVLLIESLDAYLDEAEGFSGLVFANFRQIFLFYSFFCLLLCVAFAVHHLAKLVKKLAIAGQSLLVDCCFVLASGLKKSVRHLANCYVNCYRTLKRPFYLKARV